MSAGDVDFDLALSALVDGELPPQQADAVLRRVADDPALRARYETLRATSATLRAAFAADAASVAATVPSAPDAFSPTALRALDAALRGRRLLRRVGSIVVFVALAAVVAFLVLKKSDAPAARSIESAARAVVEAEYVEIEAEVPALSMLVKGVELRAIFGPEGRFTGVASLPSNLGGGGGPGALLLSPGDKRLVRLRAGYDGAVAWRYRDGDAVVETARVDESERKEFAAVVERMLGADLLTGQGGPSLGFAAWRDVLEHAAQGGFETTALGPRDVEGEKLETFSVKFRALRQGVPESAVVGVDSRGDVRLVETKFVRVRLRRTEAAPDASVFDYRTYAPSDVEVVEAPWRDFDRGGPPTKRRRGE